MSFVYNNPTICFLVEVDVCDSSLIRYKEGKSQQRAVLTICVFIAVTFWHSVRAPLCWSLFVAPSVSLCNTSHPQNQPPSLLLLLSYAGSLLSHVTPAPTPWLPHMLWKELHIGTYAHANKNTNAHKPAIGRVRLCMKVTEYCSGPFECHNRWI